MSSIMQDDAATALAVLYTATGGTKWHTPWNLEDEPCTLTGVFCNEQGDGITDIDNRLRIDVCC